MSEDPLTRPDGAPHNPDVRQVVTRQRRSSQNPTREEQILGFRGWNERGYIPHRDEPGLTQFVTFRLADSFPEELRAEWGKLLKIEDDRERRTQLEAWLDLGHGACHLRHEHLAQMVSASLRKFDGERYGLTAFTIMTNHVHVLFDVHDIPMSDIIGSWKQYTATQANKYLGRSGPFWQADYWDTYMRDDAHEERTIRYIRNNPVKAGLLADWRQWPWTYMRDDT
ncbi:transposase [Prosthecobacter sp.]|uniref:transposase n=1 Tax=Prosthecobacter sp. TaxID=1965333 RepID=UPI003783484B